MDKFLMNANIASFLGQQNLNHSRNAFTIWSLVFGCIHTTCTKEKLANIVGYIIMQLDKIKKPNESFKEELSLKKFIWGQENATRLGIQHHILHQ